MNDDSVYYVVKKKALPEVLKLVVEAKYLLETGKAPTVQDATDIVGISRSSFYKYKDDIFQFHDNSRGYTINLTVQMDDEPGILSEVLKEVAEFKANILTIHQSIPIGGVATLSISVQVLEGTGDISDMMSRIEGLSGIHHVKIAGRE